MKTRFCLYIITFLVLIITCGCGNGDITGESSNDDVSIPENTEYFLEILSDSGQRKLIGEKGVETNWKKDDGFVWLSTSDVHEPLGTLTLSLIPSVDNHAHVASAILSITDKRFGTGEELNGKLYNANSSIICSNLEIEGIAREFIHVKDFCIDMIEVVNNPNKMPEEITLGGWFIAKSK